MSTPLAHPRSTRFTSRVARGALAATFALVVSGCGGDSGKSDKLAEELIEQAAREGAAASTVPADDSGGVAITIPDVGDVLGSADDGSGAGAGSAAATESTSAPVPISIDKTVWWGGFKITVDSAVASSNALSSTTNVSIEFENLTSEVLSFDRNDVVLTVGTQSYLSGLAQAPQVPALSRNDAVLDFLVDDSFTAEQAVLTFGSPDSNQAVVPFGAADATSFEPRELALDATLTTPIETIRLTGGTIDASFVGGEKGIYIVRIPLVATYTGGGAGGDLLAPGQFALEAPNGSSVVGMPIGLDDVVAEPVYTGQDVTGKSIAFKVKAVEAGTDAAGTVEAGTWTITYTDSAGTAATADFVVA